MKQEPITGGFAAAMDAHHGVGHEDCGHDDWGYYPSLQAIYILWCRTCGTIKQSIPSEDEMEIIGARFLNPKNREKA